MVHNLDAELFPRIVFAIYEPPAPGMPWLSVCLHPDGHIITAVPCETHAEAQAETKRCVREFMKGVNANKRLN